MTGGEGTFTHDITPSQVTTQDLTNELKHKQAGSCKHLNVVPAHKHGATRFLHGKLGVAIAPPIAEAREERHDMIPPALDRRKID